MLIYLLKSLACMATFLLFYQFLLEKENMHQFKRFYLIGTLVISLIIPALVFTEYVEATSMTATAPFITELSANTLIVGDNPSDLGVINWSLLLWSIYMIGAVVFGFRFFKHLNQIKNRIQKNPKHKEGFTTRVMIKEKLPPHTFFSYIFLNKYDVEEKSIPKEVILHEETHAKQKHSIDVLFIELLQVVLWFNPLLFLYKKCIKLNHEFLADSAVLKEKKDTKNYQNTLLSYLSQGSANKYQSIKMANAINYSSIKKRFTIMKKNTSKTSVTLRTFLLLPIVALLLFSFSERKVIQKGASSEQIKEYNLLSEKYSGVNVNILKKDVERMKYLYNIMSTRQQMDALPFPKLPEPPPIQQGASREQMKEYNALAKKYNEMPKNNMHILGREVERMEYIYGLMSEKQKADAEPFPNLPEPPPPPPSPINDIKEVPPPSGVPAPPAPPTPPNPLDHVIEMAKKGATFYYEGEKISSDKAIELLKKNKSLNIDSRNSTGKKPEVRISKAPIKIGSVQKKDMHDPLLDISISMQKKSVASSFNNEQAKTEISTGFEEILETAEKNSVTFYYKNSPISITKARQLLSEYKDMSAIVSHLSHPELKRLDIITDLNKEAKEISSQQYKAISL